MCEVVNVCEIRKINNKLDDIDLELNFIRPYDKKLMKIKFTYNIKKDNIETILDEMKNDLCIDISNKSQFEDGLNIMSRGTRITNIEYDINTH